MHGLQSRRQADKYSKTAFLLMALPVLYTFAVPNNRPPTLIETIALISLVAVACISAIVVILRYRRPIAAWIMLEFYIVAAIQALW